MTGQNNRKNRPRKNLKDRIKKKNDEKQKKTTEKSNETQQIDIIIIEQNQKRIEYVSPEILWVSFLSFFRTILGNSRNSWKILGNPRKILGILKKS